MRMVPGTAHCAGGHQRSILLLACKRYEEDVTGPDFSLAGLVPLARTSQDRRSIMPPRPLGFLFKCACRGFGTCYVARSCSA